MSVLRIPRLWGVLLLLLAGLALHGSVLANPPAGGQPFQLAQDDYFLNRLLTGILGDQAFTVDQATADVTMNQAGTMGEMMRAFNLGVAFFGSIIVLFITIVGVLQSGQDGEFLGRKWSSMWVPVRFSIGAGLLVPMTNSGYSLIQALILWIAAQGVAFADQVWQTAVNTMAQRSGQTIITTEVPVQQLVTSVMLSAVCQAAVNRQESTNIGRVAPVSDRVGGLLTGSEYTVRTRWNATGGTGGANLELCGAVTFNYRLADNDPWNNVRRAIAEVHAGRVHQLAQRLSGPNNVAQRWVTEAYNPNSTQIAAIEAEMARLIAEESAAYRAALVQQVDLALAAGGPITTAMQDARVMAQFGFATAGMWYTELARVHNAVRFGLQTLPQYKAPNARDVFAANGGQNFDTLMTTANQTLSQTLTDSQYNTPARSATTDLSDMGYKSIWATLGDADMDTAWNQLTLALLRGLFQVGESRVYGDARVITTYSQYFQQEGPVAENGTVIMQLKNKGDNLLNVAGGVLTTYVGVLASSDTIKQETNSNIIARFFKSINPVAAVGSAGNTFIGNVLRNLSGFLIPMVFATVALGLALAVFIPMTPYVLWAGGIIGLCVLIIEALVASVIWVVMIMHPSGEGITSEHSRGGMMILLTLFMRPALMVVGFVFGMFMLEPLAGFINDTFSLQVLNLQAHSITGLFSFFGFAAVYVGLMLTLVNRCFSLVHVIPDKVLRWLNHGSENLGETDFLGRAEGSQRSFASTTGQLLSSVASGRSRMPIPDAGSGRHMGAPGSPSSSGSGPRLPNNPLGHRGR